MPTQTDLQRYSDALEAAEARGDVGVDEQLGISPAEWVEPEWEPQLFAQPDMNPIPPEPPSRQKQAEKPASRPKRTGPKSWSDVSSSKEFKKLNADQQEDARRQYFDQVVAPQVPEQYRLEARMQYDRDTAQSVSGLPDRGWTGKVADYISEKTGIGRTDEEKIEDLRKPEGPDAWTVVGGVVKRAPVSMKATGQSGLQAILESPMGSRLAGIAEWMSGGPPEGMGSMETMPGIREKQAQWAAEEAHGNWIQLQNRMQEIREQSTKGDPGAEYLYDVMSLVTDMGPAIGGGILTGNPALTIYLMGGQAATGTYAGRRYAGEDPGMAAISSAYTGAVESLTEKIPIGYLFSERGVLNKLLKVTVGEGFQEAVSSALQSAWDKGTIAPDMTFNEAMAAAGHEGLLGAGAGATLAATYSAGEKLSQMGSKAYKTFRDRNVKEGEWLGPEGPQPTGAERLTGRDVDDAYMHNVPETPPQIPGQDGAAAQLPPPETPQEKAAREIRTLWEQDYEKATEVGGVEAWKTWQEGFMSAVEGNAPAKPDQVYIMGRLAAQKAGLSTYRPEPAKPAEKPAEEVTEAEFEEIPTAAEQATRFAGEPEAPQIEGQTLKDAALLRLAAPAVQDRRQGVSISPVTNRRTGDRRVDTELRQRVAEMTPEEQYQAIYVDRMTGLHNRRAFEDLPWRPYLASIDVDSLKWVNDEMSMDAGDRMLSEVGKAIDQAIGDTPGVDGYHISGDEYYVQADTKEQAEAVLAAANEILQGKVVEEPRKGMRKEGINITWATDTHKHLADQLMKEEKVRKEAAGERAGRGEMPPGVAFATPEAEAEFKAKKEVAPAAETAPEAAPLEGELETNRERLLEYAQDDLKMKYGNVSDKGMGFRAGEDIDIGEFKGTFVGFFDNGKMAAIMPPGRAPKVLEVPVSDILAEKDRIPGPDEVLPEWSPATGAEMFADVIDRLDYTEQELGDMGLITEPEVQTIGQVPSDNWFSDDETVHEESINRFLDEARGAGWVQVGTSRDGKHLGFQVTDNQGQPRNVEVYKAGAGMGWNVQVGVPEKEWRKATQVPVEGMDLNRPERTSGKGVIEFSRDEDGRVIINDNDTWDDGSPIGPKFITAVGDIVPVTGNIVGKKIDNINKYTPWLPQNEEDVAAAKDLVKRMDKEQDTEKWFDLRNELMDMVSTSISEGRAPTIESIKGPKKTDRLNKRAMQMVDAQTTDGYSDEEVRHFLDLLDMNTKGNSAKIRERAQGAIEVVEQYGDYDIGDFLGLTVAQLQPAFKALGGTKPRNKRQRIDYIYDVLGNVRSMRAGWFVEQAARAKERSIAAKKRQKINPEKDDLLVAIAKSGGLDRAEAEAQGVDPADFTRRGGNAGYIFRKEGGLTFDEMAEKLSQDEYPVFEEADVYSENALLDSLMRALAGEKVMSMQGMDEAMAKAYDDHLADLQDQAQQDGETLQVVSWAAITDMAQGESTTPQGNDATLTDDQFQELEERAAKRTEGMNDEAYEEAVIEEIQNAILQKTGEWVEVETSEATFGPVEEEQTPEYTGDPLLRHEGAEEAYQTLSSIIEREKDQWAAEEALVNMYSKAELQELWKATHGNEYKSANKKELANGLRHWTDLVTQGQDMGLFGGVPGFDPNVPDNPQIERDLDELEAATFGLEAPEGVITTEEEKQQGMAFEEVEEAPEMVYTPEGKAPAKTDEEMTDELVENVVNAELIEDGIEYLKNFVSSHYTTHIGRLINHLHANKEAEAQRLGVEPEVINELADDLYAEFSGQAAGAEAANNEDATVSDKEPPPGGSTLHANPLGEMYRIWGETVDWAGSVLENAGGWYFTALKKLPAKAVYLKERYRTLGRVAKVEAVTKKVYDTFVKATEADQKAVFDYLTDRDADPATIQDADVRRRAVATKKLIWHVGRNLVDRGLLSEQAWRAHENAYLPRVYLRYLLGEEAYQGLASGKKPSDLGYLKSRKDIPKDVRELILGEITDPAFLASRGLGVQMRDIVMLDFLDQISQNENWIFPNSLVDWNGKKVTVSWLENEADMIEKQAAYYTDEQKLKAIALVKQMRAVVEPALEELGKVPGDFKQIPNIRRYGRLRGLWVRKEIYDDILGSGTIIAKDSSPAEVLLGYGGALTKATQLWKLSKVALNPPTQVRNFVSNGVLLNLSGVPIQNILWLLPRAAYQIRTNGKHWRIAKKWGVTESTFANNELLRLERAVLDFESRMSGSKVSIAHLRNLGGIVADFAGDAYQLSEALFKTMKIMHAMEREGMSESDAALEAQKWLYDYSLIPGSVRYLRNAPVGVPFVTFYYKTLPRIAETAIKHPHRYLPYVMIPYILAALIADENDVEKEDVDKLLKAIPTWLQERGNAYVLPTKDENGRWQAVDFGYFLPWSMFTEAAREVYEGKPGDAWNTVGLMGGPFPDIISVLKSPEHLDPFSGKPIFDENDPPGDQIADIMNYVYRLAAPSWITDIGFAGRMMETLTGEVDPKSGEPMLTTRQAVWRLFGVNFYPLEPEKTRKTNRKYMSYDIQDTERRMKEKLSDKNNTPEQKEKIRASYKALIDEKKRLLKEYSEESYVHENLR